MKRNDPKDSRTYNYVYKITNNVNQKEYIGVHRTDDIDDGYMGSGKLMKRAIKKHGAHNFTKEILAYFPTYEEALAAEKELVTLDYANRDDTYNLREGGYGSVQWSDKGREMLSQTRLALWADPAWREQMSRKIYTADRSQKISSALRGKPRENAHNKDPEKIRKTANAHRGMLRSVESKRRMSIAAKALEPDVKRRRSGVGSFYIYNPLTSEIKRQTANQAIPEGWVRGSGPKPIREGAYWAHNLQTKQMKKFSSADLLPENWVRGRLPRI